MLDQTQQKAYQAALESAVYFDLSAYGKVAVVGADAATFLHNLSTNDVKNLPVGGGCEAFLCNLKARTLAYVLISRWKDVDGAPNLLLDMVPSLREKVQQHLNKYLISEQAEIVDRTPQLDFVRLAGPRARKVLEEIGVSVPELRPLSHVVSGRYLVRGQTLLGLPGYDIFLATEDRAALRDALLARGVEIAPPEVHEILRIEAGTPEYGKDMDEERFVAEVGRTGQAICYTKGCYLGQEPIVMARDRGQVNRTLMGVRFPDAKEALAHGSKLFVAEAEGPPVEVGLVTSSAWSPRLRQVVALAYVRRGHQQPGSRLLCDGREGVLAELPFGA